MRDSESFHKNKVAHNLSVSVTTTEGHETEAGNSQHDNLSDSGTYQADRNADRIDRPFAFEADINCLPMYVKRVLDRLALKIGRAQWLALTDQERVSIGQLSTKSKDDCQIAQRIIRDILRRYGTEPVPLPQRVEHLADPPVEVPAEVIETAREVGFSLNQKRWSKLSADQRYALTKLIDSGKKNKRKRALVEFLAALND